MVGLIDVQARKGQTNELPDIAFTNSDVPRHSLDGPLYITSHIDEKLVY